MKGIHPDISQHCIYIKYNATRIRKLQSRMNPSLRNVIKEEIQKFLDDSFIYIILDIGWVSPLVFVLRKGGKWRVCVDYRELNKATRKNHFPLPFIDQLLDTSFSFLDGFSGYKQIQIHLDDQDKNNFYLSLGNTLLQSYSFWLM